MNSEEARYRAWLKSVRGMTNLRMDVLIEKNGSAKEVHERAKTGGLAQSKALPDALFPILAESATKGEAERLWERLGKMGIRVCCPNDGVYPAILQEVYDPPRVLFVRGGGDLAKLKRSVAIVGSRNCSEYARKMSETIARQLAETGVIVVSGMAFGVDAAAHAGALSAGGGMATVAVLASGVDKPTPTEHTRLAARIAEGGLLISEQPLGHPAMACDFPPRNRIVAGLCQGVFVPEARKKSGTWHTLNYALDSGREIFVLPGRAGEICCEGSNEMLRSGAVFTTKVEDILERFPSWPQKPVRQQEKRAFSPEEQRVADCLKTGDKTADELFETVQMPMNRLLSLLTNLAARGIIERKSCLEYHYIIED